ncbi:cytochrome c biogenesis protein CcsA [Hahella sp. SMD15-11]|uniref:Cytochrome c biogenesis protein CcsA n=1 Tax=Thermohahella caldifontis TaxID=3142973 RepID=A0AB39V0Q6_9GAMM
MTGVTLLLIFLSALLYGAAWALQLRHYRRRQAAVSRRALSLGIVAAAFHFGVALRLIRAHGGWDFDIFNTATVISGVIAVLALYLAARKRVGNLILFVLPVTTLFLFAGLFSPGVPTTDPKSLGLTAHISLSLLSYAILSIAAVQSLLIYAQNRQLKQHRNGRLLGALPPLQAMEAILFELIYSGAAILALAIALGFAFVDDLFAQHLAHKTFFSLLSLAVFMTLIWGHRARGWRGLTAARFTLIGCILLMLGFFGSKLVLELILGTR